MDESRQTPGPKRPARISERVKREFVADYFDSCDSVEEVARRHGMSLAQGYETLCTGRFVDRYQDAARAVQARARLYVTMQSEKAARKQAELMERVEAGDCDCAVLSLPADFAGPGRALETAAALGRVKDETYQSLLSEARQNDGKADSLYTEAEQLFLDSGAFIPLMTASFTLQTGGFPAVSLANGAISFSRG